jgi:hypothetical protein
MSVLSQMLACVTNNIYLYVCIIYIYKIFALSLSLSLPFFFSESLTWKLMSAYSATNCRPMLKGGKTFVEALVNMIDNTSAMYATTNACLNF